MPKLASSCTSPCSMLRAVRSAPGSGAGEVGHGDPQVVQAGGGDGAHGPCRRRRAELPVVANVRAGGPSCLPAPLQLADRRTGVAPAAASAALHPQRPAVRPMQQQHRAQLAGQVADVRQRVVESDFVEVRGRSGRKGALGAAHGDLRLARCGDGDTAQRIQKTRPSRRVWRFRASVSLYRWLSGRHAGQPVAVVVDMRVGPGIRLRAALCAAHIER